jgi:Helix-turn-helix domain
MSQTQTPSDGLLVEREAAALLRKPERTLRQWRYLGRGPAYVRVGNSIRYRKVDLDDFIANQRVDPQGVA